jgi:hypothetical protein
MHLHHPNICKVAKDIPRKCKPANGKSYQARNIYAHLPPREAVHYA